MKTMFKLASEEIKEGEKRGEAKMCFQVESCNLLLVC